MNSNSATTVQELPDDALVCYCSQVTKGTIKKAIQAGATSVKALQESTQAGVGKRCNELNPSGQCCHSDLRSLIQFYGSLYPGNNPASCSCCKQ